MAYRSDIARTPARFSVRLRHRPCAAPHAASGSVNPSPLYSPEEFRTCAGTYLAEACVACVTSADMHGDDGGLEAGASRTTSAPSSTRQTRHELRAGNAATHAVRFEHQCNKTRRQLRAANTARHDVKFEQQAASSKMQREAARARPYARLHLLDS
eukprot:258655-Rhodomonas_salina.1